MIGGCPFFAFVLLRLLVALNEGVGVVVVDAFVVFDFNFVGENFGFFVECECNFSDHILNESRILVGLFGYEFLVRPFKHGVELSASRCFDHVNYIFEPQGFFDFDFD